MAILEKRGRDRLRIMKEFLVVTSNGALKTQIMYKTNLSFRQVNEYLSFLLQIGFLEAVKKGGKTLYKTTRKGTKYLETYGKIRDLMAHSEHRMYKTENKLIKMKSEIKGLKKTIDGLETTLMSSIECPHCQESIFPDYPFCPYCGKKLHVEYASGSPKIRTLKSKKEAVV